MVGIFSKRLFSRRSIACCLFLCVSVDIDASGGEREREFYSHAVRTVDKRKSSDRQEPEEQMQGREPDREGMGRIQNPLLWGVK